MFKAFSGALTLALTFLVISVALPEVAHIMIEIITKALNLVNDSLDLAMGKIQ